MKLSQLIWKEIVHRRFSFILGVVSVAVAIGTLVGAQSLLQAHDHNTQVLLEQKEEKTAQQMERLQDDVRKSMLKLGLNVLILPKDQNINEWYTEDTGSSYLDEEDIHTLADSGVIVVRHFLPCLQRKVKWPEHKRSIILVGSSGEVPNLHKSARIPIVQPIEDGKIVLGYELCQSLSYQVGDTVTFMGESLTVQSCHEERGNKDDITAWIPLKTAQRLLDKEGKINAIMCLQCLCKGDDMPLLRSEIAKVLPHTKVVEMGTERRLARAEARLKVRDEAKAALEREKIARSQLKQQRERLATIMVAVVMLACVAWVGILAFSNVRDRRAEIGVFRALGFRSWQILLLFLSRSLLLGITGGALGYVFGQLAGGRLARSLDQSLAMGDAVTAPGFDPMQLTLMLFLAMGLCAVAGWIPAVQAAQQDPALILRKE